MINYSINYYLTVPSWFRGFDQAFDIISLIVSFLIFLYGFRAYKLTKQKKHLIFAVAFLFIAISFFFKVGDILGFYPAIKEPLKEINIVLTTHRTIINLHILFIQIQRFFILLAFSMLFFLTRKIHDKETIFLILVLIIAISFSTESYFLFHLILAVFAYLLVMHYYKNFNLNKTKNTFFCNLAFIFIFLSQVMYMFITSLVYFYIVAEILQLAGFLFLLYTLILVRKLKRK